MRRFSQRSSLVTLNEINITPLLDLAFVLLIIFVITTPLLEKGLDLNLPKALARNDKPVPKENVRTVEIDAQGRYSMSKHALTLKQLLPQLAKDFQMNPEIVIYIRADENSKVKELVALAEKGETTWPIWWDGEKEEGPLAARWVIRSMPTFYVLDTKGIIRNKGFLQPGEIEATVDMLVKEMGAGRP